MKFETEYKNIHFTIELETVNVETLSSFFGDRFQRIPNQTLVELKKGNIIPYNLIIISLREGENRTHYWSQVLLTSKEEELAGEIAHFLNEEDILDAIVENWNLQGDLTGPAWKI